VTDMIGEVEGKDHVEGDDVSRTGSSRDPRPSTMRARRWLLASAAFLTVSTGALVVAIASPAAADDAICGQAATPEVGGDPTEALMNLTESGERNVASTVVNAVDAGPKFCSPVIQAQKSGAQAVVKGVFYELIAVKIPSGVSRIIAVTKDFWEKWSRDHDVKILPVVGPSDTVLAPVAWTGGVGLNLRTSPTPYSARIVPYSISDGTYMAIDCAVWGETVHSSRGTTNLWDRVQVNGVAGYVLDAYVDTGTNQPVRPIC